ncbi:hypothetical protein LshimejAT787_1202550 [Lyophyllum shimeji]|uniref:Uncharacterized protein n=1 Tax=Lyophyllum shimeji TaxID=47721 RepID=A0A9P3UU42_LYOSH|nr:hypothetical protein LshimejAT787_1202550 [Lyophyllum shimeji]
MGAARPLKRRKLAVTLPSPSNLHIVPSRSECCAGFARHLCPLLCSDLCDLFAYMYGVSDFNATDAIPHKVPDALSFSSTLAPAVCPDPPFGEYQLRGPPACWIQSLCEFDLVRGCGRTICRNCCTENIESASTTCHDCAGRY